jgi:hypothetical protein
MPRVAKVQYAFVKSEESIGIFYRDDEILDADIMKGKEAG